MSIQRTTGSVGWGGKRRRGRKPRRGSAAGKSSLHEFATCNSWNALLRCIHAGSGVNESDADGLTPLMHAVLSGKVRNTLALAEYGADVNQPAVLTQDIIAHKTALRYRDEFNLVASFHHSSLQGMLFSLTPLHLACMRGDFSLIYVLLANGANPRAEVQGPFPEFCGTPLDFYRTFVSGVFPSDFMQNQESTADFLGDCIDTVDASAFQIYLHRQGMSNDSSRMTCMAHIHRCETLLGDALLGDMELDSVRRKVQSLMSQPEVRVLHKGGVAKSLKRFLQYAQSPMRQKYSCLELLI